MSKRPTPTFTLGKGVIILTLLFTLFASATPVHAQLPFHKSPFNGATNILNSDSLTWSNSAFANRYYICIDTSANDWCDSGWIDLGDTQSYPISGLDKGVTYSWQVVAYGLFGQPEYADYGQWFTFTTMPAPGAFNKSSPANGAADQNLSVSLQWGPATTTDYYTVCVDTVNDNVCNTSWTNAGNVTSYTRGGLVAGVTYYWQVRAVNENAITEANGGTWWSFTTYHLPGAFNKTYPTQGATKVPVTPTLTWSASSYATLYRYCVDTSNNNACDTTWTYTSATSASISGLTPDTLYYWQVEASNSRGSVGADGNTWFSFRTLPPPGAFGKTTPVDGATDILLRTSFSWGPSSDAASYQICIDTTNDDLCSSNWISVAARSVILSGLQPSTTYYWQVRAVNTSGTMVADGGVWWRFDTVPAPAVFSKTSPPDGSLDQLLSLTLRWGNSADFISYQYCFDTINDDNCNTTWQDVATQTTALIIGLAPDTTYYWQVKAVNSFGETEANDGTWWRFSTYHMPGAFSKSAPTNGAVNQLTNPILSWGSSAFADSYEYCYDTINNNICDDAWTPTAITTASLSGLTPGITYYWQVQALNIFDTTIANSGAWWSFTVLSTPGAFSKTAPLNNAVGLSANPILTWSASSYANRYEYCYDNTNNDTCDTSWTSTTNLSAFLANLTPGATYYWQVRAINASGQIDSNGGTWFNFTVLSQPGDFSKLSPPNAAPNQPTTGLTLSWEASTDVADYRYCFDTSNNSTCNSTWIPTTATSAVLTGLTPNTTYYWQVEATNVNGNTPANSGLWFSFTTLPLPGSFSKVSPTNGLTNLNPSNITLTWQASTNVINYLVCYDTVNNNSCDGAWTATTATSLNVTNLLSFSSYYWQVRAINPNGENQANNGTWWSFTTTLGAVTPTSPNGGTAPPTPTFTWPRVNGATWYYLYINDASGANVHRQWYDAPTYCTSNICSVTPAIVLVPGAYTWLVMSWGNGITGPWSNTATFTVLGLPGAPIPISPASSTTVIQPAFTWNVPSGLPTDYRIWLNGANGNVFNRWYTNAEANCSPTTCVATSPVTLAFGDYTWWIQAKNTTGLGPWSAGTNFKVVPPAPNTPVLISPIGGIATSTTPIFTFSHVPRAAWYLLEVRQGAANGPIVISKWYQETTPPVGTYYTAASPTNLLPDLYYWRIQAWNTGGLGPSSIWQTFGTIAPPGQPTQRYPSGNVSSLQPTYSWDVVGGATDYYLWVQGASGTVISTLYTAAAAGCSVATCATTPAVTLAPGEYTWWVQAKNTAGAGPWSAGMKFTAFPPPPASVTNFIAPIGGELAIARPLFKWTSAARAAYYQLEIRQGSAIGPVVFSQWYPSADLGCAPTCQLTLPSALPSGSYSWNVRTWNTGGMGGWAPTPAQFTVPDPPAQPVLLAPNLSTSIPTIHPEHPAYPTYTWNAVSTATDYWLYTVDPSGVNIISATFTNTICSGGVCSIRPVVTHAANGTYKWWVQARNSLGMGSTWSIPLSFNLNLPAPGLITPTSPAGGAVTSHFPVFTWPDSPNATTYKVEVLNGVTVVFSSWLTDLQACGNTVTHTTCTATSNINIPSGPYSWWVLSYNQTYAVWGQQATFTVGP